MTPQPGPHSERLAAALPITRTDVLAIGAGIAGLTAALRADPAAAVVVVSKGGLEGSSSQHAQGGMAAASDDDDTPQLHAADTIAAGRGLCRPSAVDALVREGPAWVEELLALGVPFDPGSGLEAGHGRRRVHRVGGAATGQALVSALVGDARARPNITIATQERVLSLWVSGGRCIGALTDRRLIAARATVLASGGYAALWRPTTNPTGSRGEGISLAFAAGAAIADLEFVQFHPTALADGFLLTEALRGEGALLLDERGARFTNELAPRDEEARAIAAQGRVWLDLRPVDLTLFPTIARALERAGHDPSSGPVPVSPAAHYTIGGVVSDLNGRTNVASLFAVGECACTGVHGANRLASNSLLECLVFGARAGAAAADEPGLPKLPEAPASLDWGNALTDDVRDSLAQNAGIVREPDGLRSLLGSAHPLVRLIASSCLARAESRGTHYRSDRPQEDLDFAGHFVLRGDNQPILETWN